MNEREHFLAWHRLHIKRRPLPYSSGACVKVRWVKGATGAKGGQGRGTRGEKWGHLKPIDNKTEAIAIQ